MSDAIPQCGIDLIKEFEALSLTAYPDPRLGWELPTIGYGTTIYPNGHKVGRNDVITPEQAEEYLLWHVEHRCRAALERIPTWIRMNDERRGALYSFAYNLGSGFYEAPNFRSITLVCDSPARWDDYRWVREQFVKYRNPGTNVEAGLKRRREAEARMFCGVN